MTEKELKQKTEKEIQEIVECIENELL